MVKTVVVLMVLAISLIGLFGCAHESTDVVSSKVLKYLRDCYNETFVIKEILYYDTVKEGTWTHKSSRWNIKAAPQRMPDLEFSVVYNNNKKSVVSRGQADFYLQEYWRYQVRNQALLSFKEGTTVPSIKFQNMSSPYKKIIDMIQGKVLSRVPDFQMGAKGAELEVEMTVHLPSYRDEDLDEAIQPFLAWLNQSGCARVAVEVLVPNMEEGKSELFQFKLVLGVVMNVEDPAPTSLDLKPLLFRRPLSWRDLSPIFRQGLEFQISGEDSLALKNYEHILAYYQRYGEYVPFLLESAWNASKIYYERGDWEACLLNLDRVLSLKKMPSVYFSRVGKKPYNRRLDFELMDGKTHYSKYLIAAEKMKSVCLNNMVIQPD